MLSSMSIKQNLSANSSIEAELAGVADYLHKVSYLRLHGGSRIINQEGCGAAE